MPSLPSLPPPPPMLNNPCEAEPYASMAWCDASLSLDERVADAVGRMSLEEKIGALGTGGGGEGTWAIASLGLRDFHWWNEASHGVTSKGDVQTTNFVLPLTAAQSFNRSMWRANGRYLPQT